MVSEDDKQDLVEVVKSNGECVMQWSQLQFPFTLLGIQIHNCLRFRSDHLGWIVTEFLQNLCVPAAVVVAKVGIVQKTANISQNADDKTVEEGVVSGIKLVLERVLLDHSEHGGLELQVKSIYGTYILVNALFLQSVQGVRHVMFAVLIE